MIDQIVYILQHPIYVVTYDFEIVYILDIKFETVYIYNILYVVTYDFLAFTQGFWSRYVSCPQLRGCGFKPH